MASALRALILGDVVGSSGSRALFFGLKALIKEYHADLVIVNCENAAEGFGVFPEDVDRFFEAGVDVITSGNHIWQKKEIYPYLDKKETLLRPANYPKGVVGHGACIIQKKKVSIGVLNLIGRSRMGFTTDCPFQVGKKILKEFKSKTDYQIIDFHAEDTQEKEALAFYLDGQASFIFGTHTHIQTADERILPQGTGYITDIGMVGPNDSVIGADPAQSIERSLTQLPIRLDTVDKDSIICGVLVELESGKTKSIERIMKRGF